MPLLRPNVHASYPDGAVLPQLVGELRRRPVPDWLVRAEHRPDSIRFDLQDILTDSLYYPACGKNGTPVKFLSGMVHSFIYVDYAVTLKGHLKELFGDDPESGFLGYECFYEREILRHELVPDGWTPPIRPESRGRNLEWLKQMERAAKPFGHWSLWRRKPGLGDAHGAELFSFFYLGAEMSATYQGLYSRFEMTPLVLTVIQPGAMGGEWEGVEQDGCFFQEVVRANPAGMPPYLLRGGFLPPHCYHKPCWSDYGGTSVEREYEGYALLRLPERGARLWRLRESTSSSL